MKTVSLATLCCLGLCGHVMGSNPDETQVDLIKKDGPPLLVVRNTSWLMLPDIESRVVRTNATTGAYATAERKGGLYHKDTYYPVLQGPGGSKANKDFSWSMVLPERVPSMKVKDALLESNVAVYVCETFWLGRGVSQPGLIAVTVRPPGGTNSQPTMTSESLWSPLMGSYSELKSFRMAGSFAGGDLTIEITAIEGDALVHRTNRLVGSTFVRTQGKAQPFPKRAIMRLPVIGSHVTNHLGNIVASYKAPRQWTNRLDVELEIRALRSKPARLTITNCLRFIDARLDEDSGDLAVVFVDRLHLVYERYSKPQAWQLVQRVPLVVYGDKFETFSNQIALMDLDTVRAGFIEDAQGFRRLGPTRQGVPPPEPVLVFRISAAGDVTINGNREESRPPELNIQRK